MIDCSWGVSNSLGCIPQISQHCCWWCHSKHNLSLTFYSDRTKVCISSESPECHSSPATMESRERPAGQSQSPTWLISLNPKSPPFASSITPSTKEQPSDGSKSSPRNANENPSLTHVLARKQCSSVMSWLSAQHEVGFDLLCCVYCPTALWWIFISCKWEIWSSWEMTWHSLGVCSRMWMLEEAD